MPVRFIIGRAGSGKTHHCVSEIAAALRADPLGPAIYWIVPRQATFMAERTILAAAGAFCRARIVSFDQLGREIFAYAGGNVIPEVTPLGRQMVIGHLLRQLQPQLRFFASSARQPGLSIELDAAFAEWERAGKSTADMGALVDEFDTAKPTDIENISLLAKLRDMRLVYDEYAKFIGQDRLDQHQRLRQVLACVDGCPPLRGATVYVDGFTAFNDYERRLLAGIAKVAARVEIALLMDPKSPVVRDPDKLPDDDSLFHQTEQTFRKLWFTFAEENATVESPLLLDRVRRFANPTLAAIERETFASAQSPPTTTEAAGVEFVIASTREAEVDAVARAIRKLWRDGVRLREVAVLVRELEPYHGLIDASFREHGIAYFVDRRRSASHHPLLQFVRAALQVARFDWPSEPLLSLAKSGLAGLSASEADEVENFVASHYIRGSAWRAEDAWTFRRRRLSAESDDAAASDEDAKVQTIDALRRRVADRLRPFTSILRPGAKLSVRDIAIELFALLDGFGVRKTLALWADTARPANPEHAAEHEQVWAEFVDLCEQMVDLLGDEPMQLDEFVDVLESGLERFDLALTPPTLDQVLVGQIDRTRCPDVHAAFVLGLNDGEFPRVGREPSVLTESERRELRHRNVELDADRRRQLLDEDLLGYIALTRASKRLIASRPRVDADGRPANPSRYWDRLRELLPDAPLVEIPEDGRADPRVIESPRQVLSALMHWVRSPESDPVIAGVWANVYQWLATSRAHGKSFDQLKRQAWPALRYQNDAALSRETAAALFGMPLEATAQQLETFATCPFKHFVRHGLGLSGPPAAGVSGLDLSQVYHKVLDMAVGEALEKRKDWDQLEGTISPKLIHEYSEAVGETLRGELMLTTARNEYILGRVERTLAEVVAAQAELLRRGQFRPALTGVAFGETGRIPALRVTTPSGGDVLVHGAIDRVDLLPGETHAAVFDYKLTVGPLSLQDVRYGLALQLLTYLLVLQSSGEELAGKPLTPVAAFYMQLLRRMNDVEHPDDALDPGDPRFNLRIKPRGVFDGAFLPAFDRECSEGRSDVVAAYIKKDGTFGRSGSDVVNTDELATLLALVRRRIGEIADEIVSGKVDVTPYRLGRVTPCPQCEYRSVCRFEPSINRYVNLQPISRDEVLSRETQGDTP